MSVSADALRTHIDYTAWASRRLVEAVAQLTPEELTRDFQTASRSVLDTLVHIFAADRVWLHRLQGKPFRGSFIDEADRSLIALQNEWPLILEEWKQWGAALTDAVAAAPFIFADLKGQQWAQPRWQAVLHVVNHGTHHRGQVAGFLRSMGHAPPYLDLVYYYRDMSRVVAG